MFLQRALVQFPVTMTSGLQCGEIKGSGNMIHLVSESSSCAPTHMLGPRNSLTNHMNTELSQTGIVH